LRDPFYFWQLPFWTKNGPIMLSKSFKEGGE
jgi:hypothetical protein